ncbi:MAG TPA: hypothetical protein VF671_05650 [Pseudomonas sp.]|jgi:hypothetical protein|uniref:hypothetical protein n=1 Tax=Pseudomonas sp. TaxID=306 RepID=UPI002EDAEDFF
MNKRLSPVSCNSGHFLVQPNITLQNALEQAAHLLASASTLSAETSDADLQTDTVLSVASMGSVGPALAGRRSATQ